jgi:16S rRNA processing protein RimM
MTLLEVGYIGKAHGLKGEVVVHLTTDRLDRVDVGSRLQARGRWLTIEHARQHADRWIVSFAGVADRNSAEALGSTALLAEPLEDADAHWVHQLIGARVVEASGIDRGTCTGVLANPAHDILELDTGALVPAPFVVSVADGVITINPPDGLFEVYDLE